MSAAELRQAAETLRERVEDATPGAWVAGVPGHVVDMGIPRKPHTPYAVCYGDGDMDQNRKDAAYIATMHPGVGLALADWLDATAERVEDRTKTRRGGKGRYLSDAIRIARLINGGAS